MASKSFINYEKRSVEESSRHAFCQAIKVSSTQQVETMSCLAGHSSEKPVPFLDILTKGAQPGFN